MEKTKLFTRVISSALVTVMLVGSIASCAKVEPQNGVAANITVASSDAEQYAEWLYDRLEKKVPDDVVVGIGDSSAYAVDMSTFEDDGYVIKKQDDAVVIFGKTEDGLDRGVRKYANSVDLGVTIENTTYHEGARIEELKLFGTDISEFVIVYQTEYNRNMQFAAEEMKQLLKKATGYDLDITQSPAEDTHKIEFRHTDDPALEDDGYRYFEENGNLVIEGAVARGCSNGAYRFLDNELGWECLIFGDSYLPEADIIEIPAGLSAAETPIMDYLYVHTNQWNQYVTDRTNVEWNGEIMSYGPFDHAHHGFSRHEWTNVSVNIHTGQICYSSDGNIDNAYDNIIKYIKAHEAQGGKAGVTLKDIDVSQGDNNRYCMCAGCAEIVAYDKSNAGPVLYFANTIAEYLEYDGYENMAVHIFAYFSTKKPPEVTKAHPNVHVTFAQNGNCSNHSMYGEECELHTSFDDYMVTDSNADNDLWLSKWCEVSDNVVVWYYALDTVLHQYSILDFMLDDFRYMDEHGIRGMFWQITHHGFGVKRVEQQLGVEINWDRDMTDEEYEAELCKILAREYGPGWKYIREYIDLMIEATDRIGCFNCWGYGNNTDAEYDEAFMRETYKTQIDLIEKAIKLAGSADEEYRCKLLSCSIYYSSVFSHYFIAYENEDTAKLEEMNELYNIVYNRIVELGFNPEAIVSVDNGTTEVYSTMEEEAWNIWRGCRERHTGKTADELRDPPVWVMEIDAAAFDAQVDAIAVDLNAGDKIRAAYEAYEALAAKEYVTKKDLLDAKKAEYDAIVAANIA